MSKKQKKEELEQKMENHQNPITEENKPDVEVKDEQVNQQVSDVEVQQEDKLAELTAQLEEMKDKYLRLTAEFDNYRKRTLKEKTDILNYASEEDLRIYFLLLMFMTGQLKVIDTANDLKAVRKVLVFS
jgi:molecular chaperone GrpE